MRLDHLLSREYEKSARINHGFLQRETNSCFKSTVLYSFEGANALSKGQKDEGRDHRGGVAQLGEHLLCKQGVIGSNPFISTNFLSVKESWQKKATPASSAILDGEKRPGTDCMRAHSSAG